MAVPQTSQTAQTTPAAPGLRTPADLEAELKQIEEQTRTLWRVTTTRSPIVAPTPKETIWTLNKA